MPFVWDEKYRLGINEIDRQHQTFLLLLNKAHDFYTYAGGNLPAVELRLRVLKDLASIREFARAHFATEESFMTRFNYPRLAEHQREHARLLDIAAFLEEKITHPGDFSPTEWIEVMLQWYDHHVQHIDREMGIFLKGVEDSMADIPANLA